MYNIVLWVLYMLFNVPSTGAVFFRFNSMSSREHTPNNPRYISMSAKQRKQYTIFINILHFLHSLWKVILVFYENMIKMRDKKKFHKHFPVLLNFREKIVNLMITYNVYFKYFSWCTIYSHEDHGYSFSTCLLWFINIKSFKNYT